MVHDTQPVDSEYLPAGHAWHGWADPMEYMPFSQAAHVDAPSILVYEPAGHSAQAIALPVENRPGTHGWHAYDPVWFLYFPAPHAAHPPGWPENPGGQGDGTHP